MTNYNPNVIMTYAGRLIDPTRMTRWDVDYHDVAHALAHINRYTGHAALSYSVAEHCCRVHDWLWGHNKATPETCLMGLWHDAAEAYIGDVAAPLKRNLPGYKHLQSKVERAVNSYMKALYDGRTVDGPDLGAIEYIDKHMCIYEARACWPTGDMHPIWREKFGLMVPEYAEVLTPQFWSPREAKIEFLARLGFYIHVR